MRPSGPESDVEPEMISSWAGKIVRSPGGTADSNAACALASRSLVVDGAVVVVVVVAVRLDDSRRTPSASGPDPVSPMEGRRLPATSRATPPRPSGFTGR